MASTTTNYGLEKPVYSEKADVAAMNTNMDKIDTALGGLDAGIAIVANGNTHAAISEGQYVYIRGHNSLAEGLYRATANIAANGTLSGTNVTSAVMGTALAALSGSTVKYTDVINNLTSTETSKPLSAAKGKELSDQITNVSYALLTVSSGFTGTVYIGRCGKIRTITGAIQASSSGTDQTISTLLEADRPPIEVKAACTGFTVGAQCEILLAATGILKINVPGGATNNSVKFCFTYFVQ